MLKINFENCEYIELQDGDYLLKIKRYFKPCSRENKTGTVEISKSNMLQLSRGFKIVITILEAGANKVTNLGTNIIERLTVKNDITGLEGPKIEEHFHNKSIEIDYIEHDSEKDELGSENTLQSYCINGKGDLKVTICQPIIRK